MASAVTKVGLTFGRSTKELWNNYLCRRHFSAMHWAAITARNVLSLSAATCHVDTPDAQGKTALAWAVEACAYLPTQQFIVAGADVTQMVHHSSGWTPLLQLAISGPSSTNFPDDLKVVEALLQGGADPRDRDHEGWNAMHMAVSWDRSDMVASLLAFDTIDLKLRTYAGQTARDMAMERGNRKILEQLDAYDRKSSGTLLRSLHAHADHMCPI